MTSDAVLGLYVDCTMPANTQIRLPRRRQLPPIKGGQELLRIIMNYYEFIRILRGVSKELQTSEDFLGLPRTSEHVLGLA